ncbi:TT1751-like protein [Epithele typhae]|uniref:TT1751-like protein n=1 Tax=Epithele typhae TaxID=378194 RepID=UPI002008B0DA|nr:TT1751-like protein [Epithele typhae]KAH9940730.1 TT1751-like protein [Epithele typhae]
MSKTVVEYTARRITYETTLPIDEVTTRLDQETNRSAGGPEVFRILRASNSKAEIEEAFTSLTARSGFVYFMDMAYHGWLSRYKGEAVPKAHVYVIGNPLFAANIVPHDFASANHIPPRMVIYEIAPGSGTRVVWDDLASIVSVPQAPNAVVNPQLRAAAEDVAAKLEVLVQKITRVD